MRFFSRSLSIAAAGLCAGVVLTTGLQAFAADDEKAAALPLEDIELFADVYGSIKNFYVDDVPDSELMENAIKYNLPGGKVFVSVCRDGDQVLLEVADTGIGIPKDSQKKIFERFYKTDLSRGKDKKGTGLGLAIVKEIIQAHGENIDVVSTEGVGTEFIFSLPKATAL